MKDENQPPHPWIDPALEARIVASVLGETSAFEAAEIERLVAAHPELALFKRRIEVTHALVDMATRPDNPKIQLSPERRRKLLETIGVPAVAPPKKIHALATPSPWWSSPLLIRAAACLIMTGLAVALLSSISLNQTSPQLADSSGGDGGFVQSESVRISVQEPANQSMLSPFLSAPDPAGAPMQGRVFNPPEPPTAAPVNLGLVGNNTYTGRSHTVTGGTIITQGAITEAIPDLADNAVNVVVNQIVPSETLKGASDQAQALAELSPNASEGTYWDGKASTVFRQEPAVGWTDYADNKPVPAARLRFWTDDETSKFNMPTAQEEVAGKQKAEKRLELAAKTDALQTESRRNEWQKNPQVAPQAHASALSSELAPLEKAEANLAPARQDWDSSYMYRGVDVLAANKQASDGVLKETMQRAEELSSDMAAQATAEKEATGGESKERSLPDDNGEGAARMGLVAMPRAAAAKDSEISGGNQSAGTSVRVNAVDKLLFGTPVVPETAPASNGAATPPATLSPEGKVLADNVIDQPVFTVRGGQPVEFDGFISYGNPIVTARSGEKAQVQVVREFQYPTEFEPPQVEEAKKLLQEADGFSRSGRYDLAFKRYEQTLAADPDNIAARRGMEKVNVARQKYASAAFNDSRLQVAVVDAGWELPVRRFDIGASLIIEQPQFAQSGTAAITRKLDEIVIPRVDLQDVSVREALEFLKVRAEQLDRTETDSAKKGVNVVLNLPEGAPEADAKITLGLTDIPLGAAINYVASAANLKIKIEPYAVSVVHQSSATDVLVTKEYQVPPGFIPTAKGGAQEYLRASGLTFPPGATAYYIAGSNKLIVKNTQANLDLVETLAEASLASPAPDQQIAPTTDRSQVVPTKPLYQQDEILASKEPFSTFSLHVSDVSFQLAKDALARGTRPDPERIRAEEFYNAFDYNDPAPGAGEEVSCRIEQAAHPFLQQRNLVRIAVKVAAAGRAAGQPLRLTILLDTSGSMEREDRAASVRRALQSLVSLLGANDRVTLIGFARTPRLLAEDVPGDQGEKLVEAAASTPSQGGTNLEEALALASELALKHQQPDGQNRIVLLTDGAANLGNANPERLAAQIAKTRQQGISFDACGVGAKGLNDEILEALTRKGDGRYYFLNKPEDADEGFARQLAGAFRPAAENVKVQVVFNPARVARYRLIGFEKHLLKQEDFRDDKVQAAELAAEEAGVALYQIEPLPQGSGELGEVFVRFRDPATGRMVERSWTMPYEERTPSFDQASPSLQLAATAALLAEKLRGNDQIDLNTLAPVQNSLRARYGEQQRVDELLQMFERVRR